MSKKGLYFPNLNGLRFIAAFMVILHHYQFSRAVDTENFYGKFVMGIGKLGVMLFFTLSGFLITYLLLTEKEVTQTVDIKKFYIRRILRIWPLYYLIVLSALFILNNFIYTEIPGISGAMIHQQFGLKCVLFLCMLPNIAMAKGLSLPFADQAWSIGVEEQFYLFWPLLIKKTTNAFRPLLVIIIAYISLKIIFTVLAHHFPNNNTLQQVTYLISLSCFDVMAVGGLAAFILFNKHKVLDILFSNPLQLVVFIATPLLMVLNINFGFFQYEVYGLLFAVIIINLAGNKNVILNLENKLLHYLGKISYGLYMYHLLGIRLEELVVYKCPFLKNYWVSFLLIMAITIGLSALSYELFEKIFIKRKIRFSNIISGDNYLAKEQ